MCIEGEREKKGGVEGDDRENTKNVIVDHNLPESSMWPVHQFFGFA